MLAKNGMYNKYDLTEYDIIGLDKKLEDTTLFGILLDKNSSRYKRRRYYRNFNVVVTVTTHHEDSKL